MVAVKEIATAFAGGVALVTSIYGYAYFANPSIYFPSKDCIMTTYLPNPLFILPIIHILRFIAYLYCFFTNARNCEYLIRIVTGITYIITITISLCVYLFYIVPSLQPPPSPTWFKPSIIDSPAVTGSCLKNGDVCRNLATSPDFFATVHRPILHACCVPRLPRRRSVPRSRYDVWDLAMQDHADQLNGTETAGYVAFGCMAAYVESIWKASELDAWATITFEAIVNLIFFLLPVRRSGNRAVPINAR